MPETRIFSKNGCNPREESLKKKFQPSSAGGTYPQVKKNIFQEYPNILIQNSTHDHIGNSQQKFPKKVLSTYPNNHPPLSKNLSKSHIKMQIPIFYKVPYVPTKRTQKKSRTTWTNK